MIKIENLSFRYKERTENALSNINITVADGDFLGIIGPSGAGKSTFISAINGIVPHHFPGDFYGSVIVDGVDTVESGAEQIARSVGSVFQDIDGHIVTAEVEDEILFGLENFGVPHEDIESRLNEALNAAHIADLRERTIYSLSGGQKQKVAIAAITALRPNIMVLDEPTGELDPQSSRNIFEYLRTINEKHGITVIIVEQKIMLLCEFVKRLALMDKGSILIEDTVDHVLQNTELFEQAGVNIPRVTTLGRKLQEKNWYSGTLPFNVDQAEHIIKEILLT
ncbi:MAG: energy-coupling factor ABC transporter ATP-binding protein [Treponema sp.]|jgi:energy-coupling factor transport system ATP-binding protein|nr:energy-coupling factor ABC transporter ATP-binding protein [Treponema sp.]